MHCQAQGLGLCATGYPRVRLQVLWQSWRQEGVSPRLSTLTEHSSETD